MYFSKTHLLQRIEQLLHMVVWLDLVSENTGSQRKPAAITILLGELVSSTKNIHEHELLLKSTISTRGGGVRGMAEAIAVALA